MPYLFSTLRFRRDVESVKGTSRLADVSAPESAAYGRQDLPRLLRQLREQAGLSGREAARRAGFGQPKLSKIENGLLLPSPADAQALCRIYGAAEDQRAEILDLIRMLRGELRSARVILNRGAYRQQQRIARIESASALHRSFDLGAVIGLVQTRAYMRQVFSRRLTPADQDKATAARLERQQVLDDPSKRFVLIMTEGALRWHAGSPELMAAQMDHLAAVSRRPNVRLGVIPWTRPVHVFPGHEFHLYDDRLALVAVETATATIADPRDIAAYIELFGDLERLADTGDAARQHLARIAADYRVLCS